MERTIMNSNTPSQNSLPTKARRKRHSGFTLIELLATLTIMAIIAAILFPFIGNYTAKANKDTNVRSLRLLQDAMDRYRSLNDNTTNWGAGGGVSGTGDFANHTTLSSSNEDDIIENITDPGEYQTMRMPADGLTNSNMVIVRTGTNIDTYSWEVMRFRKKVLSGTAQADGVDREQNTVEGTSFLTVTASGINNAFDGDPDTGP